MNITEAERRRRLKKMLEQIAPHSDVGQLRDELQSSKGGGADDEMLDNARPDDNQFAIESMEAFVNNGIESIDDVRRESLEAIIHRRYRPALYITNDTYIQGPSPWDALLEGGAREMLHKVIPCIGRIDLPNHPNVPYAGTGFVVGDNVLMTNRHVAAYFVSGAGTDVYFTEGQAADIDFVKEQGSTKTSMLSIDKPLMIHPYWDMALLAVNGLPAGLKPLKLSVTDTEELTNGSAERHVVTIGYPAQDRRNDLMDQLKIFERFEVKRLQPGVLRERRMYRSYGKEVSTVTHDCSTLGGNSGSAIIDIATGEVVGLHFAGEYMDANFAVPAFELARDARVVDAGVRFAGSTPASDVYPSLWANVYRQSREHSGAVTQAPPAAATVLQPPGGVPVAEVSPNGGAEWIVPVHINVRVGAPVRGGAMVLPGISVTSAGAGVVDDASTASGQEWFWSRRNRSPAIPPFDIDSLTDVRFNWKAALSTALASQLAYDDPAAVIERATNEWQFTVCKFIAHQRTQCFVASSDAVNLVSFRGTQELHDWLTNLKVITRSTPFGLVHRGFMEAFDHVAEDVQQVLDAHPNRALVLTGHSLGGAIATLAAGHWIGGDSIMSIYTFGQPAAGRGRDYRDALQGHYGTRMFRFVNDDDIVPMVPPLFSHVGELFHIDAKGNLQERRESVAEIEPMLSEAEFQLLQAQLRAAGAAGDGVEGLLPSFRDHGIARYIEKVAKQVAE